MNTHCCNYEAGQIESRRAIICALRVKKAAANRPGCVSQTVGA